jgi:hypothetical protein
MVREGIVLGHKILEKGIEVDKVKIEVIEQLPPPTKVKGIHSFLGHAGFYRRFIQKFSQIAQPLTHLLAKDAPICLHGRVPSIVPHFEEGTHFRTCYTAS